MNFTIHKGKHRASPLYWLCWWPLLVNPEQVSRKLCFTFSSKYDLGNDDQQDHNKLFGIAYGNIHRNSARFGWRYDNKKNVFILSAYCYINGERVMTDLCTVVANHWYDCHIICVGSIYTFKVINQSGDLLCTELISKGHNKKLGWLLGPYFGGNRTAPHDIIIELKKMK